jgi:hypothetical protein
MVTSRMMRSAATAISLLVATTVFADPPTPTSPKPDPIKGYEAHTRQGFKVMLSRRLPAGAPMLGCLDKRLAELVRVVPAAHLSLLRDITFWIESGNASEPSVTRQDVAAFYVPLNGDYKRAYGMLSEKKGGIVILDQRMLLAPEATWFQRASPGNLLHEVAHAMQDRLVTLDHPASKTAYQLAIERKLYNSVAKRVLDRDGQIWTVSGPPYAKTNHVEYFAELSTAYLGLSNLIYPSTRSELKDHDPSGYELMDKFWQSVPSTVVNEFPFPVTVHRVAESGRWFRLFDLLPGKEKSFDGWDKMALVAIDQLDGTEYWFAPSDAVCGHWRLRSAR